MPRPITFKPIYQPYSDATQVADLTEASYPEDAVIHHILDGESSQ